MIDKETLQKAIEFHGHKCPAMPIGLRAGLFAMGAIGAKRSQDKELFIISETGKGHAAGCFLDGIMYATGCTYGKANIEKKYYNKMAFTLIDKTTGKSVRISLKPEFLKGALNSPFVQKRKAGILPQDIEPEVTDPLVSKILELPDEDFLDMGNITVVKIEKKKGMFDALPCEKCGELTFVNKLRVTPAGEKVCIPCSGYDE